MKLDKLTVRNIRSYEEQTVSFPNGIILLSGDIGSGKTSLLLAVEFALFGFIRGSFSGSSLLRHGCEEGSVTLTFTVGETTMTTHRVLRRTSRGIRQDTGWYEVDGDRFEATAREIKAAVIDILGYPSSVLTKSKSLLYRYTVYTPQEEMKHILRESAEDRLEKIRKVLRVDKYRRVKENVREYARDLRRSIKKEKDGLADKDDLEEKKEAYQESLSELREKEDSLEEDKEEVDDSLQTIDRKLEDKEEERRKLTGLEKKEEAVKSKIETVREDLKTSKKSLKRKKSRVEDDLTKPDVDLSNKENVETKQKKVEELLQHLQDKKSSVQSKKSIADTKIDKAKTTKDRIVDLDTCPTCGQDVDQAHKDKVKEEQDEIINEEQEKKQTYDKTIRDIDDKIKSITDKKQRLKQQYKDIVNAEKQLDVYQQKKKRNKELQDDINELKETIEEKQNNLESLRKEQETIQNKKSAYDDLKETVNTLTDKKEALQRRREKISSNIATCQEKQRNINERIDEVNKDIEQYKDAKQAIQQKRTTHTWITEHFTNLLDVIEQHVLLTVHQRFDESFRAFFNDLLEDDNILVDVDNEFSPRVTQQGNEMDIDDLSGGEKTSVALAYRLAMNEVINDYMHEVKTEDLIVLDEPTDGFSGEQLDRLRDILNGLRASQIILVSHEEKLEGVTEHIIRVRKANHRSQIVS